VLGSKPSRDAGNPPVIMLAQAVRIERTWASFRATLGYQQPTPEEIWRAVKELNPARSVLETDPRPAPNPKWRKCDDSNARSLRRATSFQGSLPADPADTSGRWRRADQSKAMPLRAPSGFQPSTSLSMNGGRRSIETQERKPLICFRGSDRLPARYTFQNLRAGPRVFRSAGLRRVSPTLIGVPGVSAQIARADARGKIHVVAVVGDNNLFRGLSRCSLVAGEMTEGDVPKIKVQLNGIRLAEPRCFVLDADRLPGHRFPASMTHNIQAFYKGIKQIRDKPGPRRGYIHSELAAHLGSLGAAVLWFSHNLADVAGFGPADPVRSR
jgi:hypothetical protein